MKDITIFLAECARAAKSRESKVKDIGECFGLKCVFVKDSSSWSAVSWANT